MPRPKESLPFDEHLISTNPRLVSLIDRLQTGVFDFLLLDRVAREPYRYVMQVVLLNLFVAWKTDDTSVAIPLRSGYWTKGKRPNHNYKISWKTIKNVKEAFEDSGLLKLVNPHMYGELVSTVATYKATRKLKNLLEEYEIRLASLEIDSETFQVIRMRDVKPPRPKGSKTRPKGKLIPIGDNLPEEVWTWERQAQELNHHLRMTHIDLYVTEEELTSIKRRQSQKKIRKSDEEQFKKVQFHKKFIYRVFNNKKWDNGGRFYGAWWQSVPSAWRHRITIDNHITREKDYTSVHFYILYNQAGLEFPTKMVDELGVFDPYDLSPYMNWADEEIKQWRDVTKLAMNIMLNAKDQQSAIKAMQRDRKKMKIPRHFKDWKDFVEFIRDKHKDIDFAFCSGKGVEYQFIDSKVANRVMEIMLQENGVMVLPIHDSFICHTKHEEKLDQAMFKACKEELGITIPVSYSEIPKVWKNEDGEGYHPTSMKQVEDIDPEQCPSYFKRLQEFSDSYPADVPIVPPDYVQPTKKMKANLDSVDGYYLTEEQLKERRKQQQQTS